MSVIQAEHFASIDDAVHAIYGDSVNIERMGRISGGDINEAFGVSLSDGTSVFIKKNRKENINFFETEVDGLQAIQHTGAIGSPEILCTGIDDQKNCSFLILEMIQGKKRITDYWGELARELAAMHRADTKQFVQGGKFGFLDDNYIGAGEQKNTAYEKWVPFFRDCRLKPQFERASHYFSQDDLKKADSLLEHLEHYLIEPEKPSLLHGDLWSGNVITGNDGKAWLIDPAVYVGHAEADIAMTELFGGFSADFYGAYQEAGLLQKDYVERKDIYNLYHLLNHLNLFGGGYLHSVLKIIRFYAK